MDKAEHIFNKLANIYMDGHTYAQAGKMEDNEHNYKDPSKRPYAGKMMDNRMTETPVATDRDVMQKEQWEERPSHMAGEGKEEYSKKEKKEYSKKEASVDNIISLLA